MSSRWPWFEFRYFFVWWPVCWQGWVTVFVMWALGGCALLLKPYIPDNSPYGIAEVVVLFGYVFFAFSKTNFPQMPRSQR
jgi:hypothetical protein